MSTETPIAGGDLAGLVADETVTRKDAETALSKLGYAIKQKFYVSVKLYKTDTKTAIKIYPLEQKQAEFLNHQEGETVHIPAADWKAAYDENPISGD